MPGSQSVSILAVAMESLYIKIFFLICSVLLIVAYSKSCHVIYSKHKWNLKPVNIFEMSLLVSIVFKLSFSVIFVLDNLYEKLISSSDEKERRFCKFYLLGLLPNLCFNTDLLLALIDRFLAVYWTRNYRLYKIRTAPLSERCSIKNYYSKIKAGVLKM